jgi:orotate phosphoribosyltransferase
MTAIGQEVAKLLWQAGAVRVSRQQPFILAAGWASPVYIDCRLLIGEPKWRRTVTALAVDYLEGTFAPKSFDAIAGAETAGIVFAAWLADNIDVKLRYVRKRSLGVGHNAQVEGGPVEGLRVLLMDDLTTDGSSKLGFTRGLKAAGADVQHVLTIFYHDAFPGARERLSAAGLTLKADHGGRLSAEDSAEVERFLADPIAWSTRQGGRSAVSRRADTAAGLEVVAPQDAERRMAIAKAQDQAQTFEEYEAAAGSEDDDDDDVDISDLDDEQ